MLVGRRRNQLGFQIKLDEEAGEQKHLVNKLVGRRRNQLEFLLLRPQMKLDEQAGMQQKLAKKCQVGWTESYFWRRHPSWALILVKLDPQLGDQPYFRRG